MSLISNKIHKAKTFAQLELGDKISLFQYSKRHKIVSYFGTYVDELRKNENKVEFATGVDVAMYSSNSSSTYWIANSNSSLIGIYMEHYSPELQKEFKRECEEIMKFGYNTCFLIHQTCR